MTAPLCLAGPTILKSGHVSCAGEEAMIEHAATNRGCIMPIHLDWHPHHLV